MLTYAQLARYTRAFEAQWGGMGNTRKIEMFIATYKTVATTHARRPGDPVTRRTLIFLRNDLKWLKQEPLNLSAQSALRELDREAEQAWQAVDKLVSQTRTLEVRQLKLGHAMEAREDLVKLVWITVDAIKAASRPDYAKFNRMLIELEDGFRRTPNQFASKAVQAAQAELRKWDIGKAPNSLVVALMLIPNAVERQIEALQKQLDEVGTQMNAIDDVIGY